MYSLFFFLHTKNLVIKRVRLTDEGANRLLFNARDVSVGAWFFFFLFIFFNIFFIFECQLLE